MYLIFHLVLVENCPGPDLLLAEDGSGQAPEIKQVACSLGEKMQKNFSLESKLAKAKQPSDSNWLLISAARVKIAKLGQRW